LRLRANRETVSEDAATPRPDATAAVPVPETDLQDLATDWKSMLLVDLRRIGTKPDQREGI